MATMGAAHGQSRDPCCPCEQEIHVCCMGGQRSPPRWALQPSTRSSSTIVDTILLRPLRPQHLDMHSQWILAGPSPQTLVSAPPQACCV